MYSVLERASFIDSRNRIRIRIVFRLRGRGIARAFLSHARDAEVERADDRSDGRALRGRKSRPPLKFKAFAGDGLFY